MTETRLTSDGSSEIVWIFHAVRKHLTMIALVVMAMTLLATLYVLSRTKEYTAYAEVLIEQGGSNFGDLQETTSYAPPSIGPAEMESELKLAGSGRVLRQVIEELELTWPEGSSWNPLAAIRQWLRGDTGAGAEDVETENLRRLREELTIERDPLALVISIGYTSSDPGEAALVANTIAKTYLDDRIVAERRAVSETARHLGRSTDEMGAWLRAAESEIEKHRGESDLYAVGGASPAEERYNTLSQQLTEARLALTEATTRLSQANEAIAEGRALDSIREVQASTVVGELRRQETVLRRQMGDLASQYGVNHPIMKSSQAEIDGVRLALEEEIARNVEQLRLEELIAKERFDRVEEQLEAARTELVGSQANRIRLRELERNASAQRRVYEAMLERFQRAREQEKVLVDSAQIISPATVPIDPSNISGILLIAVTAAGSCAAGIGLALLMEIRHLGYTSAAQLEQELDCPVLGMLPLVREGPQQSRKRAVEASAFIEGIRGVVQAIAPLRHGHRASDGNVVLITSCFAGEGKTTLAMSLARQAGFGGLKVLFIEGDLRKAGLRDKLRTITATVGLPHVLKGTARSLDEAIVTEPASAVDVLLGFGPTRGAFTLLRSRQMAALIRDVKQRYDLIVVDAPPLLAVSDTRTLVGLSDEVIHVVRWQETDRSAVRSAIRDLLRCRAVLAGVVLTQVNIAEHLKYGGADRFRYGHQYGDYAVEI